jgi:hypothetical protein
MAQSAADRRRAQRRLAREIRTLTYRKSPAGRQAREKATELEEQRRRERERGGPPIEGLKKRVKRRKYLFFYGINWRQRAADRMVDESSEYDAMREFLEMDEDTAYEFISEYARWLNSGIDDGRYDGIDWSFLFYH